MCIRDRQCPADFKNQIGNPDIVIVFTGTVAHKMVRVASGQAEKSGAIIKPVSYTHLDVYKRQLLQLAEILNCF